MDLAWDDARLFLALCRARTLGQAARALGLDASTLSRRLDALESALATTLFERGRDGIAPTPAAAALLPAAEGIEAAVVRFTGEAESLEQAVAGVVRVACTPDLAEVVVAPLVPELRERHPALRLEIHPGEAVVDLARREADLAVRTVRPGRGDLVVLRLGAVGWVPVAAPALARSLGTLRALEDAPWIGFGAQLRGLPAARWLEEHAPQVEPVVRADGLGLQVALARLSVGVALLPAPSAAHYGLVPVRTAPALRAAVERLPRDELFLAAHRLLRKVPRVRAVWELLAERIGARIEA